MELEYGQFFLSNFQSAPLMVEMPPLLLQPTKEPLLDKLPLPPLSRLASADEASVPVAEECVAANVPGRACLTTSSIGANVPYNEEISCERGPRPVGHACHNYGRPAVGNDCHSIGKLSLGGKVLESTPMRPGPSVVDEYAIDAGDEASLQVNLQVKAVMGNVGMRRSKRSGGESARLLKPSEAGGVMSAYRTLPEEEDIQPIGRMQTCQASKLLAMSPMAMMAGGPRGPGATASKPKPPMTPRTRLEQTLARPHSWAAVMHAMEQQNQLKESSSETAASEAAAVGTRPSHAPRPGVAAAGHMESRQTGDSAAGVHVADGNDAAAFRQQTSRSNEVSQLDLASMDENVAFPPFLEDPSCALAARSNSRALAAEAAVTKTISGMKRLQLSRAGPFGASELLGLGRNPMADQDVAPFSARLRDDPSAISSCGAVARQSCGQRLSPFQMVGCMSSPSPRPQPIQLAPISYVDDVLFPETCCDGGAPDDNTAALEIVREVTIEENVMLAVFSTEWSGSAQTKSHIDGGDAAAGPIKANTKGSMEYF